jgi:protein-disulfide isomerase
MSKQRVPAMSGPRPRPQAPKTRKPTRTRPSPSRNRMLLLALAGAGIVAAVLIGVSLLGRDSGSSSSTPTAASGELPTITAAGLAALEGIPQNGLVLGNPKAKATLVEYGDLQCPACASFATSSLPTLVQTWIKSGKVRLEFRGMDFIGEDSTRALRFVHAAAEHGKGWSAVELLYANQGQERTGWVTDDMIRAVSKVLGLDPEAMVKAASSTSWDDEIDRSDAQAKADGVTSTPSFLVKSANGGSALIVGAQPPEAFTAALQAATE